MTDRKLIVTPYDTEWPEQFREESDKINQALGGACVALHHIGSTSVPGLHAKPVIDIVAEIEPGANIQQKLIDIGYTAKGEYNIPLRQFYSKRTPREVHLHVYDEGNPEVQQHLMFRDHLRNNPNDRDEYAALKRKLTEAPQMHEKTKGGLRNYTLGKDKLIVSLIKKSGSKGLCVRFCLHQREWDAYNALSPDSHVSPQAVGENDDYHFVLYQGPEIIGIACLEFKSKGTSELKSILSLDPKAEGHFRDFLNRWTDTQNIPSPSHL